MIGPTLFLNFIKDKVRRFSDVKFILFADDTTVFALGSCLNNLVNLINEAIHKVETWLEIICTG